MSLRVLSLNCQRGYQSGLRDFLKRTFESGKYDFLLLQEFAKEVPSYVRHIGPYELLEAHDDDADEPSQLCIAYRKHFKLLESSLRPFALMRRDPVAGFKHSTFGFLFGRFAIDGNTVLVGSMHLHSGMNANVRAKQVRKVKKGILSLVRTGDRVVFGGDGNFGFPGEGALAKKILGPEFVCATCGLGATIDSRYVENVPHLPNRVAAFLSLLCVSVRLRMDYIFVDAHTASHGKLQSRLLPDRVSDHSPVELELHLQ